MEFLLRVVEVDLREESALVDVSSSTLDGLKWITILVLALAEHLGQDLWVMVLVERLVLIVPANVLAPHLLPIRFP